MLLRSVKRFLLISANVPNLVAAVLEEPIRELFGIEFTAVSLRHYFRNQPLEDVAVCAIQKDISEGSLAPNA